MVCHFPVPSTSLKQTGRQFHEYTELLKAILKLLARTGNVALLELLHTTLQETHHVHRATIQTSLKQVVEDVSAHIRYIFDIYIRTHIVHKWTRTLIRCYNIGGCAHI